MPPCRSTFFASASWPTTGSGFCAISSAWTVRRRRHRQSLAATWCLPSAPINGATALSGASPYFTENPGDSFEAWDCQATFDYMPVGFLTFRLEYNHRAASVPYFEGHGGVTPPGGNQGLPGSLVPGWSPDLVPTEDRLTLAMLIKM